MNNIKKSIIATSIIGTMFAEYEAGKLDKTGETLRKRAGKYMRKRSKSNYKEFENAILITDKAWKETVNHFVKNKTRIEAKSTIRAVYNYFSKELSKYANIQDKHIEKLMILSTDDVEAEHNSDMAIDYLIERLGLEKRQSSFKTRLAILKGNLITEWKLA